ncbi:hypothetical protein L9F63_027666 [Diploptera punctata]|uniref:Uncharacterized protein n=1 Tax=Diploptera punctata TaxID=6984 RepID=A0AAD7Z915_DIPPU|nr:hypothetical protein L9F63_007452 [Diploptera punctata]KAJ9593091.1 hypothetical protein L9F63_027666 [Diploptera punctata]
MLRFVLLGIFAACFLTASSLICDLNACHEINCATDVEAGHRPPCRSDQVKSTSTMCGCCEVCVTLVDEGGTCGVYTGINAQPLPYDCKEGLDCVTLTPLTGVCMKELGRKKLY